MFLFNRFKYPSQDGGLPVLPPKWHWHLCTRLQGGLSFAIASGEDVCPLSVTCLMVSKPSHQLTSLRVILIRATSKNEYLNSYEEELKLEWVVLKEHVTVYLRYGGLVVLLQTSPESTNIFVLLQRIFRKETPEELENVATRVGLSSEEYKVHKQIYFTLSKYKLSTFWMYLFSIMFYLGFPGLCSWSLCKHGQLQIFWRHQICSKST